MRTRGRGLLALPDRRARRNKDSPTPAVRGTQRQAQARLARVLFRMAWLESQTCCNAILGSRKDRSPGHDGIAEAFTQAFEALDAHRVRRNGQPIQLANG